jgi:hypothetical protein
MKKGDYVALWLSDLYARELLGVALADAPSRWVAIGKFRQYDTSGIGLWLSLDKLEERKTGSDRVIYRVTPNVLMLRWNGILTIQQLKDGTQPEIGIRP